MVGIHASQGVCRSTGYGVIRARGADAAAFLQGQLTNDVQSLDAGQARLAGYCSAKGRLLATFVVSRPSVDEFWLACARSVLAPTLKRLSMFVLRAKCSLTDASAEIDLFGLAGDLGALFDPSAGDLAVWQRLEHDGIGMIRLPDSDGVARGLVAIPTAHGDPFTHADSLDAEAWRRFDVQSAVIVIEAATVDRFVPQMVNFELVGGVDFQKGCYPGQEVVARSQYRGTTKRRAFLFACDVEPRVGEDVFDESVSNEPVGTVAMAAGEPRNGSVALIELRLTSLDASLRLGAVDGALLRRLPMPYAVPVDVAAAA